MHSALLEVLCCPHCITDSSRVQGSTPRPFTVYKECWLVAPDCGRKYPLRDGIPILLIEEGDKWIDTPIDDLPVPPRQD